MKSYPLMVEVTTAGCKALLSQFKTANDGNQWLKDHSYPDFDNFLRVDM